MTINFTNWTINQVKSYINDYINSNNKLCLLYKILKDNGMLDIITQWCPTIIKDYPIRHQIYWFLNDITEFPKCVICGKEITRIAEIRGYIRDTGKCCSIKCCRSLPENIEKYKQKSLQKYGVDSPNKLKSKIEKTKQTFIDKYGVDNPLKNNVVKEKLKQTLIERYGVDSTFKSKDIRDKCKKTMVEKYGVEHCMQNNEIKQKSIQSLHQTFQENGDKIQELKKQTCLKHYGVEHQSQSEEVRKKTEETCIKKYGHKTNLCNETQKERIKNTNIERYNTPTPCQNDIIKQKLIHTNIQKYGGNSPSCNKEVLEKIRNTTIQHYGVECSLLNDEIKQKSIKTCLEKYGTENCMSSSVVKDKITRTRKIHAYNTRLINNILFEPQFTLEEFIDCNFNTPKWKCKRCNLIFEKDVINYTDLPSCPNCDGLDVGRSKIEDCIIEYIQSIYNGEIIRNDRHTISPYEIDIFLKDINVGIELNGAYWHSTRFISDTNYHLNKTINCENKNIRLLHIMDIEWNKKQDIVKSKIKNLISKNNIRIFARKCNIQEIDYDTISEFLICNHMQGTVTSKYNYGLYYNNELVSVMSFGPYRKSMGRNKIENEYELLRFCSKLNYCVIGGASKLLKYFINHLQPKKIISYADRRWSIGNVYELLNFKFIRNTKPNYRYLIKDHLENRFNWRKSELSNKLKIFDPNLSEKQNMENNGYYQIYDCGSKLYELTL